MRALRSAAAAAALAAIFTASAAAADNVLSESTYTKRGATDFDDTVLRYLRKERPKIVNGRPAEVNEYPWQVSLVVSWIADASQGHFCGGSVLNDKWILTAAHCLAGLEAIDVHVVAGATVLSRDALRVNAMRTILHPNYNTDTQDEDIALIELNTPLPLGPGVQPIPLLQPPAEADVLARGAMLTVTGWGATAEGGSSVKALQEVDIPFVTREACNDILSYDGRITENMICAGLAVGGQDSCQGDSGGPLVFRPPTGEATLVGVVSWGEGCARPGKYGVYTRLTRYGDWIKTCTESTTPCQ